MKKPRPRAIKQRAAKTAAVTQPSSALAMEGAAAAEPERKKPRANPVEFYNQVIAEGRKITWPSRKETVITSVMVFIMVLITGLFFMVVDFVLHNGIDFILKFANSGSLS